MGQDEHPLETSAWPESEKTRGADPAVLDSTAVEFQDRFRAARNGSQEDLGVLLESSRNYLLLIANLVVKRGLQPKVGGSDLVQETLAEAHRVFDRFEGTTERELLGWLRRILENKIGYSFRFYYGTASRDARREFAQQPTLSHVLLEDVVISDDASPSAVCGSKEEWDLYRLAFAKLGTEDQEVIRLRVDEELLFEEVGFRMNRSADAARKAYSRAVRRLQELLDNHHDRPLES